MIIYYIAYKYGTGLEMIDGPFGTLSETQRERDNMIGTNVDDPNLVVVRHFVDVEEM